MFDDREQVECPNCPLEGKLSEITDHIVTCEKWAINCPKCRGKVLLAELGQHDCPLPSLVAVRHYFFKFERARLF